MIILSGVLVVVAIALLVAGIVAGNGDSAQVFGLDALVVIYISIAVSIISALCLAIGVFLRRKELWGSGASAAPARASKRAKKDKRKKAAPPAPAKGTAGVPAPPAPAADPDDDVLEMPAPPADVPDDAMVFVVRGRKRYHLDTCRQLAGRDAEELTYAEAKEEGFSPCTACLPDTALAARAAASVPASAGPGKGPRGDAPGTAGAASREPGPERSGSGPAGPAEPAPAPTSFDTPRSFDTPASFDRPASSDTPGSFDRKGAFDRTAEIPRADEPAAPEPPAADPAGPTLTDLPAAGLFGKAAEKAPSAPETAAEPEPGDREPEARSVWERPAEADSASPDATVDLGPASYTGTEATPKPRHAHDTADDDSGDEDAAGAGEGDALAPGPVAESGPSAADSADDEPAAEPAGDGPQVRILSGTKRYHRVDCALIEDIGDEADDLESLSRAEAKSRGCTPCLVCQPDRLRARD
ncbi:hypothetical protein ABZ806_10090 [Spirillospora sp. NPDC047418]